MKTTRDTAEGKIRELLDGLAARRANFAYRLRDLFEVVPALIAELKAS